MNKKLLLVTALMGSMVLAGCNKGPVDNTIAVSEVDLNVEEITLHPGESYDIAVTIEPENATFKNCTWESSDEGVVVVDENGHLTATGNGTATVTVTCGTITKTVTVHVETLATGLSLDQESLVLEKGQSATLNATITPVDSSYRTVTWASEDPNIASVNENGYISALSRGTTTITASLQGTNFTQSCAVEVLEYFALSFEGYEGIELSYPARAAAGKTVTVTARETEAETYDLSTLIIFANYGEEEHRALSRETDGSFTFTMPAEAVALEITYVQPIVEHSVELYDQVAYEQDLTITGASWTSKKGHELSFNVALKDEEHYILDSVRLAGEKYESNWDADTGVLTFTMPDDDVRILVEYHAKKYAVVLSEDLQGAVTLSCHYEQNITEAEYKDTVSVNYNSTHDYWKTHKFLGIKVNGGDLIALAEGAYSISFEMPGEAVTIEVVSEEITYDLVLGSTEHLSLKAFRKVGEEYQELEQLKVVFGERIYLGITNSDEQKAVLSFLDLRYTFRDAYGINNVSYTLLHNLEGDYYYFDVPGIMDGTNISIYIEEAYIAYRGAAFVGNYLMNYFHTSNTSIEGFSSSLGYKITETGIVYQTNGKFDYNYTETTIKAYDEETNTITIKSGNKIALHDNLMFCSYGLANGFSANDMVIAVRLGENETANNYKLYAEKIINKAYIVIQLMKKNADTGEFEACESALYYVAENRFVFDTELVFAETLEEKKVTDSNAEYDILKDGETLLSVYTADGARKLKDGKQGSYLGRAEGDAEDTTLLVDGKGQLTYKEEQHAYEINEDGQLVVTIRGQSEVTTMTFTLGEGTFTVVIVTEQEEEPEGPAFVGHSYKTNTQSSSGYHITIEFTSETACNINAKSSKKNKNFTGTVAYNAETGVMTIQIDTNADWYSGKLTLSYDAEANTFTVTARNGDWNETFKTSVGYIFSQL